MSPSVPVFSILSTLMPSEPAREAIHSMTEP